MKCNSKFSSPVWKDCIRSQPSLLWQTHEPIPSLRGVYYLAPRGTSGSRWQASSSVLQNAFTCGRCRWIIANAATAVCYHRPYIECEVFDVIAASAFPMLCGSFSLFFAFVILYHRTEQQTTPLFWQQVSRAKLQHGVLITWRQSRALRLSGKLGIVVGLLSRNRGSDPGVHPPLLGEYKRNLC